MLLKLKSEADSYFCFSIGFVWKVNSVLLIQQFYAIGILNYLVSLWLVFLHRLLQWLYRLYDVISIRCCCFSACLCHSNLAFVDF